MFGSPETTTGGNALKFYASQRLDIRKIGNIQEGDQVVGSRHRVKVKKNKVAPPFREAEFDMDEFGVSRTGDLVDLGVKYEVIEKSGSFFKYQGEVLAQGREATKAHLAENSKLAEKIEQEICDKVNGVAKPTPKAEKTKPKVNGEANSRFKSSWNNLVTQEKPWLSNRGFLIAGLPYKTQFALTVDTLQSTMCLLTCWEAVTLHSRYRLSRQGITIRNYKTN